MKHIIGFVAMLLPVLLIGQSDDSYPTVNNYVPDIVLHDLINYKDTTARLSDFKGKVVILGFWGTHCGTCIKEFKMQDSLQNVFKDRIQFILITHPVGESFTSDTLKQTFKNWRRKEMYVPEMPITGAGNEHIIAMFPHEYIPHYVWIDSRGRIAAITSYQLMNAQTIETLLNDN